jgi:hypothetical protein
MDHRHRPKCIEEQPHRDPRNGNDPDERGLIDEKSFHEETPFVG